MTHTNGNGSKTSAFLAGAFIGAGVALLFAPQTGAQFRSTLRRYAGKAQEDISEAVDTAMEQGREYVERGQEYIEQGQEALAAAGKVVDKALSQGRKYIKNAL